MKTLNGGAIATLMLMSILVGCGSGADDKSPVVIVGNMSSNNTTGANANNGAAGTDKALAQGITAPSDAKDAADSALSLTVEAAVIASVQANGGNTLVTTGTLTQSGQSFTYSAGPNDRLVVVWQEGPQTEIVIESLDGNFEVESIDAFFGQNHVVSSRISRDGIADFQVASGKSGGDREGGIVGSLTNEGVTYELDLREVGSTSSDIGVNVEYESDSVMTGTITAPGFSLRAEESHTFKSVYVDNFVVNRTRSANSVWTSNGVEYAVQNLVVRTATTNGYPDDLDFWRVEGVVTKDGQVVGEVTSEVNEVTIDIFVLLQSGERVSIDTFRRYQETN